MYQNSTYYDQLNKYTAYSSSQLVSIRSEANKPDRVISFSIKFLCDLQPIQNSSFSDLKVLIIASRSTSIVLRELVILFELNRIEYKLVTVASHPRTNTIRLNTKKSIRFNLIIFESAELLYDSVDLTNKIRLIDFCKLFKVGLVVFFNSIDLTSNVFTKQLDLIANEETIRLNIVDGSSEKIRFLKCQLNCLPALFKVTKCPGRLNLDLTPVQNKTKQVNMFISNQFATSAYDSVIQCGINSNLIVRTKEWSQLRLTLISSDLVELVQLFPTILLDLIAYSSHGRLQIELDRFVQIDIDDIFVGSTGKRMQPSDVVELVNFQEDYLNKFIFNGSSTQQKFKFNLGFSGHYYRSGNELENRADEMIISQRGHFNWFEHGWAHYQPHTLNSSLLAEQMYYNYYFALDHGLPTDSFYAVSPHHSGVYPIYDQFYEHWADIWLIKATSSEEYPHLRVNNLKSNIRKSFYFKKPPEIKEQKKF